MLRLACTWFGVLFFLSGMSWEVQAKPRCMEEGTSCQKNVDCCAGRCSKKRCAALCRPEGYPCSSGGECCQKACVESRCGGSCRREGRKCKRNQECCSLACNEGRCSEGMSVSLCDPAACLRWDPTMRLCRSRCSENKHCILGRCRTKKPGHRSPPDKQTNPPERREPERREPPRRDPPSVERREPPRREPPRREPPIRREPPLCAWQKCLHLDEKREQCISICIKGTSCDGQGRCLPVTAQCNQSKCMRYDARHKRCVSRCRAWQQCSKGRCTKRSICPRSRCLRYNAFWRRCVSICPEGTRCDGKGYCRATLQAPTWRGCNWRQCLTRSTDGQCRSYCKNNETCRAGVCQKLSGE